MRVFFKRKNLNNEKLLTDTSSSDQGFSKRGKSDLEEIPHWIEPPRFSSYVQSDQ